MSRLTDSENRKTALTGRKRRKITDTKKWFSDSQKLEAVQCWLITGNLKQTAAALSIPYDTVKVWRYSNWWKELVDEIKSENSIKLTNRLKTIAAKALDVTEDRLENGDFIYDQKLGQMVRKPVGAAVSHRIAADLITQADKLEHRPEQLIAEQKTQEALNKLQATFEDFVKNRNKSIEVTDVILGREIPADSAGRDEESDQGTDEDDQFGDMEQDALEAEIEHDIR